MLWYVAFIAALNLGAGYYWGAHLRRCPRCALVRGAESLSAALPEVRPLTNRRESRIPSAAEVAPSDAAEIAAAFDAEGGITGRSNEFNPLVDAATGLVTREHAEHLLAQLSAAGGGNEPATVALVEVTPIAWADKVPEPAVEDRLYRGVSTIVRQSLERQHTAASFADHQMLLLVPNEDVHQATRRAEELRQRVASTEFVADGQPFQTTLTCALAEITPERSGPRLFEFLQEALGEAKRYGGNRTFMHDGNSPAPVVPSELTVAPQQLAI
jgi:GGDEF domain-containing protein